MNTKKDAMIWECLAAGEAALLLFLLLRELKRVESKPSAKVLASYGIPPKSCTCPDVERDGYSEKCTVHGERAMAAAKGNLPPCDMHEDCLFELSYPDAACIDYDAD